MDITDLKDGHVYELTAPVRKPRPARSKKPVQHWQPGVRFMAHQRAWRREDEGVDRTWWELERISCDRDGRTTIHMHQDADTFLFLVRCLKPVHDVRAVLARADGDYITAEDILDELDRHGVAHAGDLEDAWKRIRARREAEAAAEERAEKAAKAAAAVEVAS